MSGPAPEDIIRHSLRIEQDLFAIGCHREMAEGGVNTYHGGYTDKIGERTLCRSCNRHFTFGATELP